VKPINAEIATIHCEYLPDAFALRHAKESRISQIHGTVRVLPHKLPDPGSVRGIQRKKYQASAF